MCATSSTTRCGAEYQRDPSHANTSDQVVFAGPRASLLPATHRVLRALFADARAGDAAVASKCPLPELMVRIVCALHACMLMSCSLADGGL